MGIIINGTLNIDGVNKTNIKKEKPFVQSYAHNVYTEGGVCNDNFEATVYSSSEVLGIGSSLYQNLGLTIPTTYSLISNPLASGGGYFILTGNIITSSASCD